MLLLRTAAVICALELTALGLGALMGPILAMFFLPPILMALAVWLVGMDMFQAFVFTIVLAIIRILLISFGIGSLTASAA